MGPRRAQDGRIATDGAHHQVHHVRHLGALRCGALPEVVGHPADRHVGDQRGIEQRIGAAQRGERFVEQGREHRDGGGSFAVEVVTHRAAVPHHCEGGLGAVAVGRLPEHRLDPSAYLVLRRGGLRHLVFDVAREPRGAVFDDCGHQRLLRGEVPVEGVVGEPGLGDDVGHARARRGAAAAHHHQPGIEQATHLFRVLGVAGRERAPGDAGGEVLARQSATCVRHTQNHILARPEREGRDEK